MGDGMQWEAERPAALPGDPPKLTINGVAFTSVRYDRRWAYESLSSRRLLPTNLMLFSCLLQLPIPTGMDLLLTAGEHVLRRDVANGILAAGI
jgi:hypothetical protein